MMMTPEDWIDLMAVAGLAEHTWIINDVGHIRTNRGECPLCALCNETLQIQQDMFPFTVTFIWALEKAFGPGVERFAAYQIADAADGSLHTLTPELQFIRLALGEVLQLQKEQL